MSELIKIVRQFDVVSFDIFDTLLLRPLLTPSDLFLKIELDEKVVGFARDRICAEGKARKVARSQGREEATLDEIYQLIPKWEGLKERELAAERACLVANPEMRDVFNAAKSQGKKVLILSDMYLPADFLKDVLRKNGIDGWDGFYVSCEQQLLKWTGALYDQVLKDTGVALDRILHIGDNAYSDVHKPNEKGIAAYCYQKIADKFYDELPFAKAFLMGTVSVEKRLFAGSIALGWHLYKCAHPQWTYWNRMGFMFAGGLCYSYVMFIAAKVKEKGIKRLLFLSRDGYILKDIFDALYPEIRTDYVYASRELAILSTEYDGTNAYSKKHRQEFRRKALRIDEHEDTENLSKVLQRNGDAVREYLSSLNIDYGTTALVDGTSRHYSIQTSISELMGRKIESFYWLVFSRPPEGAFAMWESLELEPRYHDLCEYLVSAPTPPVESIVDKKPVFKKDVSFFERFKISKCDEVADGAVYCAKHLNTFPVEVSHALWLDWVDAFLDNQTVEDKEMLSVAMMTVSTAHDGGYQNVVTPDFPMRRIKFLGLTVLGVKKKRQGECYLRAIYLFGKLRLFTIRKFW